MKVSIVHPDQRRKISIRTAKMVEENSKKKARQKQKFRKKQVKEPLKHQSYQRKVFAEEGRFCFL